MAAVLGKGACDICEAVCTAPCKLCSCVCKPIAEGLARVCSSPFCIYVAVTLGLNVPPVILGFTVVSYVTDGCRASTWLLVNLLFCLANIGAAVYLATSVQRRNDLRFQDKHTAMERISHLLCYDKWIALYICTLVAFFVWLAVGIAWTASDEIGNSDEEGGDGCPADEDIVGRVGASIGCGYAFLLIGCAAFCCSLCCAAFDGRDYGGNDTHYHDPEYGSGAAAASSAATAGAGEAASQQQKQQQQQQQQQMPFQQQQQQMPPPLYAASPYDNTSTQPAVYPASRQQQAPAYTQQHQPSISTDNKGNYEIEDLPIAIATPLPPPSSSSTSTPPYYQSKSDPGKTPSAPPPLPPPAVQPSAPPTNDGSSGGGGGGGAAAIGSAMGTKIGKLLNVNDENRSKLESSGAKASAAVGHGFNAAKKFVTSKKGDNDNK